MATLHDLRPNEGATKNRKRLGRGHGSGTHKTAGKGVKGQKARTGHHGARIGFEGGQMPLQRRLPKRGFNNPFAVEFAIVNLRDIAKRFDASAEVSPETLVKVGLLRASMVERVKVLGVGDAQPKLHVRAHAFSASAKQKIEAAGGTAEIIAE